MKLSPSAGTSSIGAIAPLSFIFISSVSQTLRASIIYLLLKPMVQLSPSISALSLSLAEPSEVILDIFIIPSANTHLTGLFILSVIMSEVLSILSRNDLVSTETTVLVDGGIAAL